VCASADEVVGPNVRSSRARAFLCGERSLDGYGVGRRKLESSWGGMVINDPAPILKWQG
jgi:hypothetical protein